MQRDIDWNADEINLKDYDLPQPQLLLPDSPICPILVKLFLQVSSLIVIPPAFFEHMPMLQVLDLSNTNILSLPTSIASLSLLQEFFLRDCFALIEIPAQVGMLSKLKLFDIKGTELMFIPKEMRKLVDLEVLCVSLSQYAKEYIETKSDIEKVIPKYMISELKKLKELCISVPPEAEWWEEEVKDIQNELCDLENLETLTWYLPTNEVLHQFLLLERNHVPIYINLSNLMLTIGHHAQLTSCLPCDLEKKFQEFRNCLKWENGEGNMNDVSKIMESAEALFLSRHWTIEKLSTLKVTNLKYCLLAECNEMESLVEVDGLPEDVETRIKNGEKVGLELLQYFSIHHMEKLQSIWKGPIGKDSLSKLTILALHSCPQLTSIFTLGIAQNLSCLTELTVEYCPKIRSLITTESQNIKHSLIFPSLVRIFLLDLPELVNMFNGLVMLEKLSTLLIYNCLKLRHISIMEFPNIKKIEAEVEWLKDLDLDIFVPFIRKKDLVEQLFEDIFVPLKRKKDLVEQLFEATNSLQHFHDTLSHRSSNMISLDKVDSFGNRVAELESIESTSVESTPKSMRLLGDPLLYESIIQLTDIVRFVAKTSANFKPELGQLQETLQRIEAIINDAVKFDQIMDQSNQQHAMFIDEIQDARNLVTKCLKIKRNLIKKFTYSLKLKDVNKKLLRLFQVDHQADQYKDMTHVNMQGFKLRRFRLSTETMEIDDDGGGGGI